MAQIKNFATVMLLLAIVTTINVAAAAFSPASAPSGFDWHKCAGSRISAECGESLKSYVNYDKGLLPSRDCCKALVKIGKPCHDAFLQVHIRAHDYVGSLEEVLARNEEIWDDCYYEVKDLAIPPVSA